MTQQNPEGSQDPLQKAVMIQGNENSLDMSLLSTEEQQEIVKQYQDGLLDVRLKAAELRVDIGALGATLNALSHSVSEIHASGNSATISHTQDSAAGRTEIIVGNTERAQSGKLSRSQTGDRDWTPYFIVGGVVIVVVLIIALIG